MYVHRSELKCQPRTFFFFFSHTNMFAIQCVRFVEKKSFLKFSSSQVFGRTFSLNDKIGLTTIIIFDLHGSIAYNFLDVKKKNEVSNERQKLF